VTFAVLLKRHRVAAGLTQEALAERAGISTRTVSDLERALAQAPHRDTVARLGAALDLTEQEAPAFFAAVTRTRGPATGVALSREPMPASGAARFAARGQKAPPHHDGHNFPLQLTSFVGREQEVATVSERLATERLVTLTGAGGVGKTRLAFQVAAAICAASADGVWLVDLAPLADPALVPQRVLEALGVDDRPGQPPTATLTDHLRPQRVLLVLDNCEHLLDGCARLVEALLRSCPYLRVLATSREPLEVAGEVPWPVRPRRRWRTPRRCGSSSRGRRGSNPGLR
jgi:transcriptional regulator with XRE-family HTH domain